jgi:GYF domain 2
MPPMFKILGGDGKEYGPITVDQIKQWIGEGRANHATMAKAEGTIGWKPLAEYPEFAEALGVKPPELAATPTGASPATPAAAPATFAAAVAPAPDARARALSLVSGPAIGLIVTAVLGIAYHIFGVVMAFRPGGMIIPMYGANPDMVRMMRAWSGPAGAALNGMALLVGVFILFGALKMQKLTSHGLAMATAIVAMIPCFSPCCLLGLPFGIWALVMLSKPEVRSQFDH